MDRFLRRHWQYRIILAAFKTGVIWRSWTKSDKFPGSSQSSSASSAMNLTFWGSKQVIWDWGPLCPEFARKDIHTHCLLSSIRTQALKTRSLLSIHQIPVPIQDQQYSEYGLGAMYSFPQHRFTIIACFISSRSCSVSSFGKLYAPSRNRWYRRPFSNM